MPEFSWIAHYNDGSQFAGGKFEGIDRGRLIAFDLLLDGSLHTRVDLRPIDIDNDIGARRLIYRRRVTQRTDGSEPLFWYMIGWQRKVGGRNIQAINYVFPDGSTMLGGQFVDGDFQSAIDPLPWENDLKS